GVLKARSEATETVQAPTIPAIPLVEPAPAPPEPVPTVKPGITLGVNVLQADDFGLQVTSVDSGSNADVAGIRVGDVVTAFGDAKVRTIEGLRDVLQSTVPGVPQTVSFIRGGESWVSVVRFGGGDLAAVSIEAPKQIGGDQSGDQGVNRGFLGIVPVERGESSVVVSEVISGSCAEKMGLREGDLLVAVAGKVVTSIDVLREALAPRNVGDSIEIRFARAGQPHEAQGVLGKFPVSEGQSQVIEDDENIARPVPSSARVEAPKPRGNGKLGIIVAWDADGAYIDSVLPGSGAGSAGAHIGDRIIRVDDVPIGSLEQIGEVLSQTMAGTPVSMEVLRGNEPLTLVAHRNDDTQPQQIPETNFDVASEPPVLGIEVEQNAIGILLTEIHEGSPAHDAGLRRGDWIIRICDMEVRSIEDIQDALQYSGLVEIQMTIRRDLEIIQVSLPLQRR
ncbi:MAG: PDZ domain-containing protein, partial [Planctomycetes bacterium]|nr:PDZ domain-containing protein [Planctomycetota bacterium]